METRPIFPGTDRSPARPTCRNVRVNMHPPSMVIFPQAAVSPVISGRSSRSSSITSHNNQQVVSDIRNDKKVVLNVGGRRYVVREPLLQKFPESVLGSMQIAEFFDKDKGEYFFDRDPDVFRYILNYLRTGRLHISEEECFNGLLDELEFFKISTEDLLQESCCEEYYGKSVEQILNKHCDDKRKRCSENCMAAFELQNPPKTTRNKVWDFLTEPDTSYGAVAYSYIVAFATLVNAILIVVETVPCEVGRKCAVVYGNTFFIIDTVCVVIFTGDYFSRLAVTPKRFKFVKGLLNIIDLIALIPFYLTLIFKHVFGIQRDYSFMAILRLFRVFRIIKFAKKSERLRSIASLVSGSSGSDVAFVFVGILLLLVFFSTIIYYLEQTNSETQFESIPDTMWYTVVTITSLGYGDKIPSTILGKFFGIMTILVGFLGSSLLIPIVQMKFGSFTA